MAELDAYPVGQAPWEQQPAEPTSFPVGQAPWEGQGASEGSGNAFLDAHPTLNKMVKGGINDLPFVTGAASGLVGAGFGTAMMGPGLGTAIGAAGMATAGGAAGSYAKDWLNGMIYGKDKPAMDSFYDALETGGEQAFGSMLGEGLLQGATTAGRAVLATKTGAQVGELVSNVPAKIIQNYAKGAERINALFKTSDENTFRMAQAAKDTFEQQIDATHGVLNKQISETLATASKDKSIDITPVVNKIQAHINGLNPELHKETISELTEVLNRMKGAAPLDSEAQAGYIADTMGKIDRAGTPDPVTLGPNGKPVKGISGTRPVINDAEDRIIELPVGGREPKFATNLQGLYEIQTFLKAQAEGAYGGTTTGFQIGTKAARAARDASGAARDLLEAMPEAKGIIDANAKLSQLHNIEASLNKGLLAPRASAQALKAAGIGESEAGQKGLADLTDIQGITQPTQGQWAPEVPRTDMVQSAQDVASASMLGKSRFAPSIKGLGQPLVRNVINMPQAPAGLGATLSQSVIHGTQGVSAIRREGR